MTIAAFAISHGIWMLKSSLVVGLALLWAHLRRRSAASVRHAILLGGFVVCGLIPIVSALIPNLSSNSIDFVAKRSLRAANQPIVPVTRAAPEVVLGVVASRPAEKLPAEQSQPSVAQAPVAVPPGSIPETPQPKDFGFPVPSMNYAGVLVGAWLLGVYLLSIRIIGSITSAKQLIERARPDFEVPGSTLQGKVRLLQSSEVESPVTYGWHQPVVVFPEDAQSWESERLRGALAHEMAHIRRRDWLISIGIQFFLAVQWFNPVMWLGAARLRDESELSCDDEVVMLGVAPVTYASTLYDLARSVQSHRSQGSSIAMVRCPNVESRVRSILSLDTARRRFDWKFLVGVCLASAILSVPSAAFRPALSLVRLSGTHLGRVPQSDELLQPAPSDPVSDKATVELPFGVTVNLASFSYSPPPYGPNQAWSSTGEPWESVPYSSFRAIPIKAERLINIGFTVKSETDQDVSMFGYVCEYARRFGASDNREGWSHYRRISLKAGQNVTEICSVGLPQKANTRSVFYALGIAAGPWETIYDREATVWQGHAKSLQFNAGPDDIQLASEGHRDTVVDSVDLAKFDYHIVGLTRSGRVLTMRVDPDTSIRATLEAPDGDPVHKILIERRPWMWSEHRIEVRPREVFERETVPRGAINAVRCEAQVTSGLRVRLRAIGTEGFSATPQTHWNPDGTLISDVLEKTPFGRDMMSERDSVYYPRHLVLEFESDRPRRIRYSGYVPGVAARAILIGPARDHGQDWKVLPQGLSRDSAGQISFGYPMATEFVMKIELGEDTSSEVIPISLDVTKATGGLRLMDGENPEVQALDLQGRVVATERITTKAGARHLVALDASGDVLQTTDGDSTMSKVPGVNARTVRSVKVTRQSTQWVRFKDLHIEIPSALKRRFTVGAASGVSERFRLNSDDEFEIEAHSVTRSQRDRDGVYYVQKWQSEGELSAISPPVTSQGTNPTGQPNQTLISTRFVFGNSIEHDRVSMVKAYQSRVIADPFQSVSGWYRNIHRNALACGIGLPASSSLATEPYNVIAGYTKGSWVWSQSILVDADELSRSTVHFDTRHHYSLAIDSPTGKRTIAIVPQFDGLKTAILVMAIDQAGVEHLIGGPEDVKQSPGIVGTTVPEVQDVSSLFRKFRINRIEVKTCPLKFIKISRIAAKPIIR